MAKKIKRFFMFVFFSLFFSMLGGKREVPTETKNTSKVSVEKNVLPIQIGGNSAAADWYCT